MKKHTAKALILSCIDYRFVEGISHYAKNQGLVYGYDRLALAGSVKSIVRPERPRDAEFILGQISLARKLHGIQRVLMISHEECGAYPHTAGMSRDEQRKMHAKDLYVASQLIHQHISGVRVEGYFAALHHRSNGLQITIERVPLSRS